MEDPKTRISHRIHAQNIELASTGGLETCKGGAWVQRGTCGRIRLAAVLAHHLTGRLNSDYAFFVAFARHVLRLHPKSMVVILRQGNVPCQPVSKEKR